MTPATPSQPARSTRRAPRPRVARLTVPPASRDEALAAGRALRARTPRRTHRGWSPAPDRPDPIDLLERSNRSRVQELVPIRYGRMLASPFTYLRGSPLVMADDLSRTPVSGINVQACGDAHGFNFGLFATPERNLIFDVNDFDESLPGPWEWDVKRLAASIMVAGRVGGVSELSCIDGVRDLARNYRSRMLYLSELTALEIHYARIDVDGIRSHVRAPSRAVVERGIERARHHTGLQAFDKLTRVVDGRHQIIDDPPLIHRVPDEEIERLHRFINRYRATLPDDRRHLLGQYRFVDAARKVVGVGSVGTRCYILLLQGRADLDPLFLQVKEAEASVLEPYVGRSEYDDHGRRVVEGQRMMQAASDLFLGWAKFGRYHFYVRQLRDMKGGGADLALINDDILDEYGFVCAGTLARAHARSSDPALLAGYMGRGERFVDAIVDFAVDYADQTERDYTALVQAARTGRIAVERGL